MEAGLQNVLCEDKFDVLEYFSALVSGGDIKSQLEEGWQALGKAKDAAVQGLRENAFRYHAHILKAAREIYALEQGLDDLKKALIEEQETLAKVIATEDPVLTPPKAHRNSILKRKSRSARKSIFGYLSKIEGFNHAILKERERYFLMKRDLKEFDDATYQKRRDLIVLLFSDCMILTLWTPYHGKTIQTEYKFLELIYLDKAEATVYKSAKDKGHLALHLSLYFIHTSLSGNSQTQNLRFPFKLVIPGGGPPKLFDCESEEDRTEWIETINKLSGILMEQAGRGPTGTAKRVSEFGESLNNILSKYRSTQNTEDADSVPTWFCDTSTDIADDCEMHEHSGAVDRIVRVKKFWNRLPDWSVKKEHLDTYRSVLSAEETLVINLQQSLRCALDCPFGSDRPLCIEMIDLLDRLGQKSQANTVLLDHRSRLLNLAVDSVRPDDTLINFIRRSTDVFFDQIAKSVAHFGSFNDKDAPVLVGWVRFHLNKFAAYTKRFLFADHTSLTSAAAAVAYVRNSAVVTSTAIGCDLHDLLDANFEDDGINFMERRIEQLVEAVVKCHKEKAFEFLPFGNREAVLNYTKDLANEGLGSLQPYFDGLILNVPAELIDFGRTFQQVAEDLCRICSDGMRRHAEQLLTVLTAAPIQRLHDAVVSHSHTATNESLLAGVQFLHKNVFESIEKAFRDKFGSCDHLLVAEKHALTELSVIIMDRAKTSI